MRRSKRKRRAKERRMGLLGVTDNNIRKYSKNTMRMLIAQQITLNRKLRKQVESHVTRAIIASYPKEFGLRQPETNGGFP